MAHRRAANLGENMAPVRIGGAGIVIGDDGMEVVHDRHRNRALDPEPLASHGVLLTRRG